MQVILDKQNGRINGEYSDLIGSLEDGRYIISVRSLNPLKTEREFQNEYFALVNAVVDCTGQKKYEVHHEWKAERNVDTTTDFSLQDWVEFIDAFKWYYFKKLDLIL